MRGWHQQALLKIVVFSMGRVVCKDGILVRLFQPVLHKGGRRGRHG